MCFEDYSSSFLSLITNNKCVLASGLAFLIITISMAIKSSSILSNRKDQTVLTRIKDEFRDRLQSVHDINEATALAEQVQDQTKIIQAILTEAEYSTNDVRGLQMIASKLNFKINIFFHSF